MDRISVELHLMDAFYNHHNGYDSKMSREYKPPRLKGSAEPRVATTTVVTPVMPPMAGPLQEGGEVNSDVAGSSSETPTETDADPKVVEKRVEPPMTSSGTKAS